VAGDVFDAGAGEIGHGSTQNPAAGKLSVENCASFDERSQRTGDCLGFGEFRHGGSIAVHEDSVWTEFDAVGFQPDSRIVVEFTGAAVEFPGMPRADDRGSV